MKIGCVKEIKNNEFRVGLTPDNVKAYVAAGHHVYMEKGAGVGSGFTDNEYIDAGASLIDNAADIRALFSMTPYSHRTKREDLLKLERLQTLRTEIAFVLGIYESG